MAQSPTSKIVQVIEHEHETKQYDEVNRHIFLVLCEDGSI